MERTFERCEQIVGDLRFSEVRRWKQQHPGAAAIGYFPVYAPVELVHASGMLPVGLAGAGDRLDVQYADARFGSFICSIVKTTLEMGLTGHLDCFEGVLFSSICDSARNLCFVMKRNFPQQYFDFLHLPHNPSSPASLDFLAAEYERLAANLIGLGGRPLTDESLRHSIALFNRNRELVRMLSDFRSRNPHQLAAWESYVLVRAGNFLPVEEHNHLLEEAWKRLPERAAKRRDSLRVVVEGSFCEQPPLDFIKLLEAAGCYVVDDDFNLGRDWFEREVAVNGDPLRSLAKAYLYHSRYSSVRQDTGRPRSERMLERVRRAQADAVIFLIAKFCEPACFDYVPYRRALEEQGIPNLLLEFEEKMFTFDRLRTEVETFVESLVFD